MDKIRLTKRLHVVILLTDELLNKAVIHWTMTIHKSIRSLLTTIITSKSWKQIESDVYLKTGSRTLKNRKTRVENRNQVR